ncbi:MAG: protein translocase subunit SecF [Acidobacteria bacterium]|nr:protein translocase subunit SecF [Acidobacteriota bacterium]
MQMFTNTTYDFTRWRWHAIGLSLIVIFAGLAVIVQRGGLPVGIDFSGGTIVVVKFDQTVTEDQVRSAVDPIPGEEVVQRYGEVADNQWLIRLAQSGVEQAAGLEQGSEQILGALRGAGLPTFEVLSREIVGPVIGEDLQRRGIYATLASILAITVYIGFRFRFSFALGAIAATFHDLIVTTAVLVIFNYEVSLNIVAALLTITGYSVNDTIVIFDRVRENMRSMRRDSLDHVVNVSVNQTLARTVITAGTTFLSVLALYLFGGEALEGFAFTMLVGIVSGTYSTIFIASSIAIILGQRKGRGHAATVAPVAGKAEVQARPGRKTRGARAS